MAPDQALLQFLSILRNSEYEVERRTCNTGQRLDRGQVMLMIARGTITSNVSKNKGSGQRDAGHAFIADAGSSGNTGNGSAPPLGARDRGGRGKGRQGGRCKGGREGENDGEKKNGQTTNSYAGDENVDGAKRGNA